MPTLLSYSVIRYLLNMPHAHPFLTFMGSYFLSTTILKIRQKTQMQICNPLSLYGYRFIRILTCRMLCYNRWIATKISKDSCKDLLCLKLFLCGRILMSDRLRKIDFKHNVSCRKFSTIQVLRWLPN